MAGTRLLGFSQGVDRCISIHLQGNLLGCIQGSLNVFSPRLGMARIRSQTSEYILQRDVQWRIGFPLSGWGTLELALLFLIHD
jgi:hypothetical protein